MKHVCAKLNAVDLDEMYVFVFLCIYMYIYIYMLYMYIYIYIYVCISYYHIQSHTLNFRNILRTDRQTKSVKTKIN